MNQDEAFKILEARILELISRLRAQEEKNERLQQELHAKEAELSAAKDKIRIAADELHRELERLRVLKTKYSQL